MYAYVFLIKVTQWCLATETSVLPSCISQKGMKFWPRDLTKDTGKTHAKLIWLVVDLACLKQLSSSVGMSIPNWMKKYQFQTLNQS